MGRSRRSDRPEPFSFLLRHKGILPKPVMPSLDFTLSRLDSADIIAIAVLKSAHILFIVEALLAGPESFLAVVLVDDGLVGRRDAADRQLRRGILDAALVQLATAGQHALTAKVDGGRIYTFLRHGNISDNTMELL